MAKRISIKNRLIAAVLVLIMTASMLIGTTFAWFTDSATSGGNVIQSGKLDAEMYWSDTLLDAASTEWVNADGVPVFTYDRWEPGYTEVKYIKITNEGNLAFKWRLSIEAEGEVTKLSDVIDVYYVNPCENTVTTLDGLSTAGTLTGVLESHTYTGGELLPEGRVEAGHKSGHTIIAIAFHMQEGASNEYQDMSIGDGFALNLIATQYSFEGDSFGNGYDDNADWPNSVIVGGSSASVNVTTADDKVVTEETMASSDGSVTATIPVGVAVEAGTNKLTLKVSDVANSKANISLSATEASLSIDVHIDGVAEGNTVVMPIGIKELLPVGLNMGNFRFYHVEDGNTVEMTLLVGGATPVHNNFEYDPATGDVVLYLKSFSEVALVADTVNAWEGKPATAFAGGEGTEEDPYIIANADQFVYFGNLISNDNDKYGDKYYKLVADLNFGGEENANKGILFYPIGYHKEGGTVAAIADDDAPEFVYQEEDPDYAKNAVSAIVESSEATWYTYGGAFRGTFDGNGNTISNIYQNTWQLKGNYSGNYWNAAMGVFGYVYGGTVKNLTVDNFSSDGEFTPTGVVAAYAANSTFENIAITNSNPRVYNTGNGGIVGIGGNSSDPDTYKLTFTNITIDNTNKISALWGSWDVACGGLVGMFRGAGHVYMTNCHVAAQIDVYNDVCGNYQYYWYRYSGMMVGTNKNMITDANGYTVPETAKFHAENCTVHFGEWNNYYYCELVANSLASYTHDHQFSRLTEVKAVNGTTVTPLDGEEFTVPSSGRYNYVVVNGKASTENATCYHFVNGEVWEHSDAGEETVNGVTVLKEDKQHYYLPFNQLFTGYGWGVKHIPVYNGEDYAFEGITILDREVADSVVKFEGKVTELVNNKTYTLGDIFKFINNGVELVPGALTVTVTYLDENNPVSATVAYDRENWENSTIVFTGIGSVQITIQDYYFCTPTTIEVNITDRQPEVKFDSNFTGDFLYRIGNQNTVALGTLFAAKEGANIGTVSVTVENSNGNVSSTYTANTSDWTKATVKFSGTGIVKVTITDNDYCTPTEIKLEVIDAVNATSATSATSSNVVLLKDVGFSTIEVSGGYTLYGNGFKMTATNDVMYNALGVGFVTLKNGTLDNVQIICPNFSYSIIYTNQINNAGNTAKPSDSTNDARGNVRSAVMADGNSKIVNSYIHGGRAAIFLRSGNLVVDGSTISGGATANIHAVSAQSLTLRNATLIQKPFQATVHDTTKTVMGFSGLFECDESGNSTPLILEGTLIQDAWINENCKQYVPSNAKDIVNVALGKTDYLHDLDGDGTNESLNLGFTYIPQSTDGSTYANVTDNRTNKSSVPYEAVDVGNMIASAKVYSYKNTSGTSEDFTTDGTFTPSTQGTTAPTVSFNDTNADRVFETTFDKSDNRWESSLTITLDNGDYTFGWDKLLVQKYGENLTYTVKTKDGTEVDTSKSIALTASGVTDYILTVTDGDVAHTVYFILTATKTSIPEPEVAATTGGTPLLVVKSKNSDWSCAIPALEGIKVKYYTSANNSVTLDLATLTPTTTGKQNGTYNYWEYSNGYSLKVTCGYIHDTKQVYGMPVVVNNGGNKMYFTISSTNGYVSTSTSGRTVTLTYEFTDPNGKTLTFSKTWQFNYADYKSGTQYSYSDFVNGTLKEASSGGCVTPDTLVTLANGTQKEIQYVSYEDKLLVWNFYTGEYDVAPAAIIFNMGTDNFNVLSLKFEDGTVVKTINGHRFFDKTTNSYSVINEANVDFFLGHDFVKMSESGYTTTKLVGYDVTSEYTTSYSIMSAYHYNFIVEGMLSDTFHAEDAPLFDYFNVANNMTYNVEQMSADIEKYGLYTYDEFAEYLTYEQFVALNVQYMKISVGKGAFTYEGILELIDTYISK